MCAFFVPALLTSTPSSHGCLNGSCQPPDVLTEHKGKRMSEDGTLSIVWHGSPYQVRYASNNPYGRDRQPYACPYAETLRALLHQCGAGAGAWQSREPGGSRTAAASLASPIGR